MAKWKIRYTLPVDVAIDVDAPDEEAAITQADSMIREFSATIWSRTDGLNVDAMAMDIEPYETSIDVPE